MVGSYENKQIQLRLPLDARANPGEMFLLSSSYQSPSEKKKKQCFEEKTPVEGTGTRRGR